MESVEYQVEEGSGAVTVCAEIVGGEFREETNVTASTQGLEAIGMLAYMHVASLTQGLQAIGMLAYMDSLRVWPLVC